MTRAKIFMTEHNCKSHNENQNICAFRYYSETKNCINKSIIRNCTTWYSSLCIVLLCPSLGSP